MTENPSPQANPNQQNLENAGLFILKPISGVNDTGLDFLWLQDLVLKVLYFQGYITGFKVADEVALPFVGVVDQLLDALKREKLVEVRSSQPLGFGQGAYTYAITGLGITRAQEALERSQYAGPAPVPIQIYNESLLHQRRSRTGVTKSALRSYISNLVLSEKIVSKLGPAVNSGTSIFLYGPPGNGKTSLARAVGEMILKQEMYVPYAIYVDGQVIKLYDSMNHTIVLEDDQSGAQPTRVRRDPRWVRIKRPFIVTGGELTLSGLDLVFDDVHKYYEAPFQVKANGGILLIDDFGRQLVAPRDLLNRWIVPLENRIDYLTLHNGRKIEIPFDVLVIFSTNLPPKDLVDEAFLRRLRHKIEMVDPSFEEYREIFKRFSAAKGIQYNDQALAYLLQEWYIKRNRKLRSSHPRDICDQILDISNYLNIEPVMTQEILDHAADAYFVEL